MPKIRFSMRGMMIAVAALAVVFLGIREYRARAWAIWVEAQNPNPMSLSWLSATLRYPDWQHVVLDGPMPVDIAYQIQLGGTKLPEGTPILLWVEVAIQDVETKTDLDGYAFDIPLKVGERESASGKLTYLAVIPRPGRYYVRYRLRRQKQTGEWTEGTGGDYSIQCVAHPAGSDQNMGTRGVK